MTSPEAIAPIQALVHVAPELIGSLTEKERLVLASMTGLWLRPAQRIGRGRWRYYGFHCGRGFGKTHGIGCEINRRVRCGEARAIGLGAPTLDRVREVQFKTLVDTAPPWFRPVERKGELEWPNGARTESHSPERPGRSRSSNFDVTWLTELVDWQETSRLEFFYNITTATRVGASPQVLWDTTSRGRNDVIEHLLQLNAADPATYPIQWGELYDNPLLGRVYIASEVSKYPPGTRKHDEEIKGKNFREAKGALFKQAWLDAHRRPAPPTWLHKIVSLDPGLSLEPTADPTGMVIAGLGLDGHGYLEKDLSERVPAEVWAERTVDACATDCAGVVIETNHIGNTGHAVIKSRAEMRGMVTVIIPREDRHKPFPQRKPGTIYVREIHTRDDKGARGIAPASECSKGTIHLIGEHTELEYELTTFEPGTTRKSPNRFDAFNQVFNELLQLELPSEQDTKAEFNAGLNVAAELQKQLAAARARRVL